MCGGQPGPFLSILRRHGSNEPSHLPLEWKPVEDDVTQWFAALPNQTNGPIETTPRTASRRSINRGSTRRFHSTRNHGDSRARRRDRFAATRMASRRVHQSARLLFNVALSIISFRSVLEKNNTVECRKRSLRVPPDAMVSGSSGALGSVSSLAVLSLKMIDVIL